METKKVLSGEIPLYIQVQETVKGMIQGVEYGPGDQIPSERELADSLNISRMTVRKAIENLIAEGLLERRTTSGTYVPEPQIIRPISTNIVHSLSYQLEFSGSIGKSKLLSFDTIPAPRKVAHHLNIRTGKPVYKIHRLRLTDDQAFCIEKSYLPIELIPGMSEIDLTSNTSLYMLLKTKYNITPAKSIDRLKMAYATQEETALLKMEYNTPVLYLRSIVFEQSGVPFEYLKSINHPDLVVFTSQNSYVRNSDFNQEKHEIT